MKEIGIMMDNNWVLDMAVSKEGGVVTEGLQAGYTRNQNTALILTVTPGQIKSEPLLGVGIADMLMDNDYTAWRRRIRLAMEMDGQTVREVVFRNGKDLEINASYS